jgi:6-pyruvoyltetrahydropterin/6-carboxytetrahydropterin synthase
MITCTKRYDDLPFAHRQPKHDGHCAWIHGHNWCFEFEFGCTATDECGFVVDFGKLKWLKEWIYERFDHTLLLNADDPMLPYLRNALDSQVGERENLLLAKIVVVPDCSSEGLAAWLLDKANEVVQQFTSGRVFIHRVSVIEDSKNSATIYRK